MTVDRCEPICAVVKRYVDKAACLADLASRAAEATSIDRATILEGLTRREALGSTGVGDGVALPHVRLASLARATVLLTRLRQPLDFEAVDERPVDLVCLILLPDAAETAALGLLSRWARTLRDATTLAALRRAATTDDLARVATEAWLPAGRAP